MVELQGSTLVAKVFGDKIRHAKLAKCEHLVSMRIPDSIRRAVTWPLDLAYCEAGRFRGYLMERAEGTPLVRAYRDPAWTQRERLDAARSLSSIIHTLHSHGIAVGDASSNNVFVTKKSATLIDVDSFQVHRFPCDVGGTLRYLRPEVLRGDIEHQLGRDSDCYVLAFLLFEVFHTGLSPYAHRGGEDPQSNTKKQFFALKEDASLVPDGDYRRRWNELPNTVQGLFERAFTRTGDPRPEAEEWVHVLKAASVRRVRRFWFPFRRRKSA